MPARRPALLVLLLAGCGSASEHVLSEKVGDTAAATDTAEGGVDGADDGGDTPDPPAPCAAWPEVEGAYLPLGAQASEALPPCESRMLATAGAAGMTLQVALLAWSGSSPPLLWVTDPASRSLLEPTTSPSAAFTLSQTGEAFVHLLPQGATTDEAPAYTLEITCTDNCSAPFTRYPIVLMHGMAGFDDVVGVNYFLGVKDDLEGQGYLVAEPGVSPFAAVEDRAAQWSAALDGLQAAGYGRRFLLIAHSQAGLDSRYLISTMGQGARVAALDTIATPHGGSPIADLASGAMDLAGASASLLDLVADLWAGLLGLSEPQDVVDATAALTTDQMAVFNTDNVDDAQVYYRSWSGHTCDALDFSCQGDHSGERVNLLLWPTFTVMQLMGVDSDGMVPVESAKWGDWQGEIPGDHIDEVAELGGLGSDPFDHIAFYTAEVQALAARGL